MTSTPVSWQWEGSADIERDDKGVLMPRKRLRGTSDAKGKRYEINVLVAWRTLCSSQIFSHLSHTSFSVVFGGDGRRFIMATFTVLLSDTTIRSNYEVNDEKILSLDLVFLVVGFGKIGGGFPIRRRHQRHQDQISADINA
jgi:hypothetical protein